MKKEEDKSKKKDKDKPEKENIYQDLLIWALFADRPKMATLFWMECENQLCKNLNKDFCYSSIACFCNSYKTHFMHVKTMSERVSYIWERSYNLTAR